MRKFAVLLMVGMLACLSSASSLANDAASRMTPMQAVSAPSGFVDFCARSPRDCGASSVRQEMIRMNADKWREVMALNAYTNQSVNSGNDLELFGREEHWTIADTAGDCEDFVLLKKKRLEALGYPTSALLITVVLDENREGHAVLTLAADTGDYVLDNRRDEILPFTSTGYQFLKRQSQLDPQRWVSLASTPMTASGAVASPGR
jgi:predicted transglutaminase-like cysteine proteinase